MSCKPQPFQNVGLSTIAKYTYNSHNKDKTQKTMPSLSQPRTLLPQQHEIKKTVVTTKFMFDNTVTRGTGA
jgi:hypothetical protein